MPNPPDWTRRRWLAAGLAAALGADDPATDLDAARERGKAAGLGPMKSPPPTPRYQAIGDAPLPFQRTALDLCEALARDYLAHFKAKNLPADPPQGRLTLVILADARAYAAFLGVEVEPRVGGSYDLESNRLVLLDNRDGTRPDAERANTIALMHEATHQLTFNTGLLDRKADYPLCIPEGLATYGEVRRPAGKARVGDTNPERLQVLRNDKVGLWPVARLLDDDALLSGDRAQEAYAQSWLLASTLLRDAAYRPRFRAYLDALRKPGGESPPSRLAARWLGDLGGLDQALAGRLRGA